VKIASLIEGVLTAMLLNKIKWIGAALLVSTLAGAGVMAQQRGRLPDARPAGADTPPAEGVASSAVLGSNNAELPALAPTAQLELAQRGRGIGGGFGGEAPKVQKAPPAFGARGRAKDPRSKLILTKLDDLVAMKFADEAPLGDVLKHIKEATKSSEMPNGIPIYVDPIGLQEAEKSLTSTITIDLEGVPLRVTLRLLLKQLGLAYMVKDGMLYITSEDSYDQMIIPQTAIPEDSPILEEAEKALRGELPVEEMKQWLETFKTRLQVVKALEAEYEGHPADDSNAPLATLDEEIKKLIALNNELKQKSEKLDARMAEVRELLMQLVKREKDAEKTKPAKSPAGRLQ